MSQPHVPETPAVVPQVGSADSEPAEGRTEPLPGTVWDANATHNPIADIRALAVTIPPDLAAEIRADIEAHGERRGRWTRGETPDGVEGITVDVLAYDDDGVGRWPIRLTVGSADGGPRPDVGNRVLVLAPGPGGDTGEVVEIADDLDGRVFVRLDGAPRGVDTIVPAARWALLPDPAEPEDLTKIRADPDQFHREPVGQLYMPEPGTEPMPRAEADARHAAFVEAQETAIRGPLPAPYEPGRRTSPEMRAAIRNGDIPPGTWRPGTRCHQQLHIDAPDGATIDIGRVDSPELAAFIAEAINDRTSLKDPVARARHHQQQHAETYRVLVETRAQRDRLRAALQRIELLTESDIEEAPDLAREALDDGT